MNIWSALVHVHVYQLPVSTFSVMYIFVYVIFD